MSIRDRIIDPYEHFHTLPAAFRELILSPQFREEFEQVEDLYYNLMACPWWCKPIAFLLSFRRIKVQHQFFGWGQKPIPLRKAVRLFEEQNKSDLRWELKMGNYPVFGYFSPRHPDAVRQQVPEDIWKDGGRDRLGAFAR